MDGPLSLEEFQIVNRKRRKKKNGFVNKPFVTTHSQNEDAFDTVAFKRRLSDIVQEIKLSEFGQHSNDLIQNATVNLKRPMPSVGNVMNHGEKVPGLDLLSYGIGRFSSCPIARYQLAFLLVLREKLESHQCLVYDPVFSVAEKLVLEDLGCTLISHNEEGKRVCHSPTVVFMPHCGKALYNNLIWANLATLDNLAIVGNSFSRMMESTPCRILKKTANYVMKVAPFVSETPLRASSFVHSDVFNDLSLHLFPKEKLTAAPSDFWEENAAPEYDKEEAEIIRQDCGLGDES